MKNNACNTDYILANWCYFDNFGDALNPYIIGELTGKKVLYCNCRNPRYIQLFKEMLKSLFTHKKIDIQRLKLPEKKRPVILAIGSILGCSLPNYKVWGAGFMNSSDYAIGGDIFAVRGEYSAKKLHNDGFPLCNVYGDPALLLPMMISPAKAKLFKLGIIPHWSETDYFLNRYSPNNKIIDLRTTNIEYVVDEITSCEYVLSTSLHGVIVAHAYGIPALWIKYSDILTDGFKFYDYFSSVEIPRYEGFQDIDNLVAAEYVDYPNEIKSLMLPRKNVKEIQSALLKVAPFQIVKKFKN